MEPLQLQKQISTRTAEEPNRNEPIRGSLPSFWNRCESMRTTGTLLLWKPQIIPGWKGLLQLHGYPDSSLHSQIQHIHAYPTSFVPQGCQRFTWVLFKF